MDRKECKHRRFTIYGHETWRLGAGGSGFDGPDVSCMDCGTMMFAGKALEILSTRLAELEDKVNG